MKVKDRTDSNKYLKEYRQCHVTNCTNRVYTGGYICTTHIYRIQTHGSYDLPSYEGEPNFLDVEEAPEWSKLECKKHGHLNIDQVYLSYTHKNGKKYQTTGCRRCALDKNIKKNYGLEGGIDEYERLATEQESKCAICKQENLSVTNDRKRKRKLSIDHCHKTGKFRGIICTHCNSGLGYFRDSVEYLQAAIAYLQEHQET